MKSKQNIVIMCIIALLQGMVFYSPVATLYRQQAGIGLGQMAVIESVCLLLSLLLELPWGMLADRIGYRSTIIACCLLFFLSKIIFWKADGFFLFLLERILLAVVIAGLSGVDETILYLSAEGASQNVFGIYYAMGQAGVLAAAAVYVFWIGENYRVAGFLTVLSYGAAAVCSFFLEEIHDSPAGHSQDFGKPVRVFLEELRGILGNSRLLWFLLASACFSEVHQVITTFLNQPQYAMFGISVSAMGILYGVMTLAGISGRWSGNVTGFLGEKRAASFLFLSGLFFCGLLAVMGLIPGMGRGNFRGFQTGAVVSVLAIMGFRIAFSLFYPMSVTWKNRQIKSENRATCLSVCAVLTDSVCISVNLLLGKLGDIRLSIAMVAAVCFVLLGQVMLLQAMKS